jgi:hypothetical protein
MAGYSQTKKKCDSKIFYSEDGEDMKLGILQKHLIAQINEN